VHPYLLFKILRLSVPNLLNPQCRYTHPPSELSSLAALLAKSQAVN